MKEQVIICKNVLKTKSEKDTIQEITRLYIELINQKENYKLRSVI